MKISQVFMMFFLSYPAYRQDTIVAISLGWMEPPLTMHFRFYLSIYHVTVFVAAVIVEGLLPRVHAFSSTLVRRSGRHEYIGCVDYNIFFFLTDAGPTEHQLKSNFPLQPEHSTQTREKQRERRKMKPSFPLTLKMRRTETEDTRDQERYKNIMCICL